MSFKVVKEVGMKSKRSDALIIVQYREHDDGRCSIKFALRNVPSAAERALLIGEVQEIASKLGVNSFDMLNPGEEIDNA